MRRLIALAIVAVSVACAGVGSNAAPIGRGLSALVPASSIQHVQQRNLHRNCPNPNRDCGLRDHRRRYGWQYGRRPWRPGGSQGQEPSPGIRTGRGEVGPKRFGIDRGGRAGGIRGGGIRGDSPRALRTGGGDRRR